MSTHKKITAPTMRSGLRSSLPAAFAVAAVGGIGVVVLTGPATPSVTAAPDPCAASSVAKTVAAVATNTGNYLEANPETNQALTTISQQQGGPQSIVAMKAYLDANPDVAGDMNRLQQPLASLSGRCKLPVTIPQVLGLMQAAQQPGPPLPAALPSAQTDTAAIPATQGTGTHPGPGVTSSR